MKRQGKITQSKCHKMKMNRKTTEKKLYLRYYATGR